MATTVGRSGCSARRSLSRSRRAWHRRPPGFAGYQGIEGEQAEREVVERVLQELAAARQVGVVDEGVAQGGALVMVAGQQRPGAAQRA